jgi:hypothetical protein
MAGDRTRARGTGDRAEGAPHRPTASLALTRAALRLYPRAWRERYADEVLALLESHPVTLWTVLDVLLGAVDAHLRRDLLPERLTAMAHRLRTSEIAIFAAFVLFCVAWLPLRLVRDPLPIWAAAVAAHPELLAALTILDLAGIVAIVAILVGGLPILASAFGQAIATRRWGVLALFAIPLAAAAALVIYWLAAVPASGARQSSAPDAPLTPLAVVLQLGLVVVLLLAIGGSATAIAAAIGRSELRAGVLKFALLPAGIATAALALGLLGALALTIFIFTEAPQVSSWPPLHVADLLVMLAAAVLAAVALRRGVRAARGG